MKVEYKPYEIIEFDSYDEFSAHLLSSEYDKHWIFRAQPREEDLETTLERCCNKWEIEWNERYKIERMMIRQFKRLYQDDNEVSGKDDILYCLSLLRHHYAPARLLDFTYSRYVALYFGLEAAYDANTYNGLKSFAIWCIQEQELVKNVNKIYKNSSLFKINLDSRNDIETRNDKSFKFLYYENKYKFTVPESPAILNQRQHLQQGLFLCPGDISSNFMTNLLYPYNSASGIKDIRKLICTLTLPELRKELQNLLRMNISRESLFPGLDGIASSMKYRPWFYKELYDSNEEDKKLLT